LEKLQLFEEGCVYFLRNSLINVKLSPKNTLIFYNL